MKEDFRGLNVDLNRLSDTLEHYLDKEGFETNLDRTAEWYRIQGRKKGMIRTAVGAQRCVEIHVRGDPNTFDVEMTTGEWGKNLAAGAILGAVTFGLGWVGAGINAVTYRKLEEKIFDYIHWQANELKGTAGQVPNPAGIPTPQQSVVFPTSSPLAPQCPRCNRQVKQEFNACPYCGLNLRAQLQCPRCATSVEPSYMACPNCGVKLGSTLSRETI
jgi:hypothetical protein